MNEEQFLYFLCMVLLTINLIYFVVFGNWYFWCFCVFFLIGFNVAMILNKGERK